jgi:D-alanine--poly(phosphoribitol) ligase subunit 1
LEKSVPSPHKPWLVQHYFDRALASNPDKIAVTCGSVELTYRQVDRAATVIAHRLRSAGMRRADCVAVFMPKSVEAICSILGVLRSDGAYVPIDTESPAARISGILAACGSGLMLVNQAGRAKLSSSDYESMLSGVTLIDVDDAHLVETALPQLRYEAISVDIAYVLFTSGSTGTPKGVMISHQAVIDYIDWCVYQYQITASDQISNHAPLYFDNSTFDLYTAFAAAATLHLVPPELNSVVPRLASWLRDRAISVFFCVPSVLTLLLKSRRLRAGMFPDLRELVFAGEVIQPDVLTEWMHLFPKARFTNMYGPTEITVDCTYHVVTTPPGHEPVPIGKARPNMEVFIALENGQLTQVPGSSGELWVRGLSVGYGYLGDPDKTSKAFVQHPSSRFPDRLYRTGDLVRMREDGALLFQGRADQQIKYLGHRIELGEIEAQLQALADVDEAVVVFHSGENSELEAIGALVSTRSGLHSNDVLDLLKQRVPGYMLPRKLKCTTDPFPRTPNGKYDRMQILQLVFADSSR